MPVTHPEAAAGPTPTATAPAALTPRLRLVLVLLLAAQFMLAVDFSILNVALPVIGEGLGFSLAHLQWTATAFALCAAGFTLLFGRIADLYGRRRLFLGGLAVLGAASLLGGLAQTPEALITARVLQGLATAAVTPAALSLLTTSFPEGRLREKALGLNGALMSAGFTTGAILGGLLTDLLSWRWAFFINVPVALAVLLTAPHGHQGIPARRTPQARPAGCTQRHARPAVPRLRPHPGRRPRLDLVVHAPPAAGRCGAAAPLPGRRAQGARTAGPAERARQEVGGLGQHRRPDRIPHRDLPGLPDDPLPPGSPRLLPLTAGLSFGVLGLGTVVGGSTAPKAIGRMGSRPTLIAGGILQTVSTAALLALGDDRSWMWLLLLATFTGGIGNMLVIVGFMVTATSGLADHEQGLATGLATMTQQIGITMGTPIMSAITTAAMTGPGATGILAGLKTAVAVNAAIVLLGVLTSALFLRGTRHRSPDSAAATGATDL
jgi:MFS family permease